MTKYTCRMMNDLDVKNWWTTASINAQSAAESFGELSQERVGGDWESQLTVQVHTAGDTPDRWETIVLDLRHQPFYLGHSPK